MGATQRRPFRGIAGVCPGLRGLPVVKIYVGQAVGRDVNVQHMQCLMTLMTTRLPADVTYHPANNDALVSRSRSIVASRFLESDADVLLTIDTDIGFNPE